MYRSNIGIAVDIVRCGGHSQTNTAATPPSVWNTSIDLISRVSRAFVPVRLSLLSLNKLRRMRWRFLLPLTYCTGNMAGRWPLGSSLILRFPNFHTTRHAGETIEN